MFQARPLLGHALETEEFEELADPRLDGNYVCSEMFCMIEAAAACVRHSAAKRPRMGRVCNMDSQSTRICFLITSVDVELVVEFFL